MRYVFQFVNVGSRSLHTEDLVPRLGLHWMEKREYVVGIKAFPLA